MDLVVKTIIDKIEAVTRQAGFIYTFALILLRDLFFSPEDAVDINWHEHLNFQELTFLAGLVVKAEIDLSIPNEADSAAWFEEIYRLFDELHKKHHEHFLEQLNIRVKEGMFPAQNPDQDYRNTFGSGVMMTEPIFYGGSGAYDFQYLDFAAQKYAADSKWIRGHSGIDIPQMGQIARELKSLHERKYNSQEPIKPGEFPKLCTAALAIFSFSEADLQKFGSDHVKAFARAFSLIPGKANSDLQLPGQFNEVQARPIVQLPNGRYFLPIGFNLSEAIYETPFFWMNSDISYRATALLHRGEFAENATAELLARVFGTSNVYTDVQIKESKAKTLTDIDVLAVVGNKAVIAQVKSKRLTELAKLGDEDRLRADFKLAVQEAYDQGLLSRLALLNRRDSFFSGGKEIHLNESIDEAYILCITVDHYPAVMHQLDAYLTKQADDPFPVAMSIFDLDIVAFYLSDPFELAYYLRQRTALSAYYKADTEMSLLGVHLKQKLFRQKEVDFEMVDSSFAQLVDANFPVLRGSVPKTAAADKLHHRWKNPEFDTLVNQVKSTNEPRFTDAVFFLYDLAGEGADALIQTLKLLKRKSAGDDKSHDARLPLADAHGGMTTVSEPKSPRKLREKLVGLSRLAKYKSKANVWLGLGCLVTSDRLVDAIVFSKEPWSPNQELEELSKLLRGKPMLPSGKKLGRNQPCPCNSGKKYKHCHGAT
ncbi:MAG TPA: SEC-C domain-containing protein [Candidatus Sulfotelmatobacter sp.]|nr:SEC-C domain-containing protein [Candidatus Sulfotelmatobacter sp.]